MLGALLCLFLLRTCVHWYVVLQRNQKEELIPLDGEKGGEIYLWSFLSYPFPIGQVSRTVGQFLQSSKLYNSAPLVTDCSGSQIPLLALRHFL